MAKYLYVLAVANNLGSDQLSVAQAELRRLFESDEVTETRKNVLKIITALEPLNVERALREFTKQHGRAELTAGAKIEE